MLEHTIAAELINADEFEPYGEVLDVKEAPPVFQNPGLRSWRFAYDADGATELMVIEFDEIEMRFDRLERHHQVTQCFLPLLGRWMVMVVAEASGTAAPLPRSVRAFLVGPQQGILLRRSVWHALNRFPIGGKAVYALLTTRETQAELETERAGGQTPQLTDVHNFRLQGLELRIELPPDATLLSTPTEVSPEVPR